MNILSRMITSIIFIAIFISPIFILMNFDLPLLGDHRILIQNLFFDTESQYLQYVDDMVYEVDYFKSDAIRLSIYFISALWLLISYVWIFFSDTRKVYRPGQPKKYLSFWFISLLVIIVSTVVISWYFLYQQSLFNGYMGPSQLVQLCIFLILYTSTYYYISSLFITSSAMRTSIPLAEKFR